MRRSIFTAAVPPILAMASLAAGQATPQGDADAAPVKDIKAPDSWRIGFAATAWMMGMDGDIGARGRTVNVSESFIDVIKESDSIFAISGRVELWHGKLGGYVDGMYAAIGLDDVSGPFGFAEVDVDIDQTILDFGVMYRIGEWEASGEAAKNDYKLSLDLTGGGRYSSLDVTLSPAFTAELKQDQDWVDPVVGVRFIAPLSEHWHVSIAGDVGGFGVASEFVWSVTGLVGYDFHIGKYPSSVVVGYRAMGWDYSNGSGADEFTWDVIESGAILGFVMKF